MTYISFTFQQIGNFVLVQVRPFQVDPLEALLYVL